jgi:hypothetical protein
MTSDKIAAIKNLLSFIPLIWDERKVMLGGKYIITFTFTDD